jgi:hypothetical protein
MNDITPARLVLTALLLTPPALTLSAPARAEIDDTKAAVIRDEGQKAQAAFVAGDYATAARLYESIEPLLATLPARERELAIVRFNLGRSYDELGRRIDAIRAYRASVAGPLDEAMRGPIRARLALIEAEALGALEVRCAVAGARVELVGHPGGGGCGHRFEALTPGPYVVAVQTRGGKRVTVPAEVVAGRSESVAAFGAVEAAGVEADRTFAWVLSGRGGRVPRGGRGLQRARARRSRRRRRGVCGVAGRSHPGQPAPHARRRRSDPAQRHAQLHLARRRRRDRARGSLGLDRRQRRRGRADPARHPRRGRRRRLVLARRAAFSAAARETTRRIARCPRRS